MPRIIIYADDKGQPFGFEELSSSRNDNFFLELNESEINALRSFKLQEERYKHWLADLFEKQTQGRIAVWREGFHGIETGG